MERTAGIDWGSQEHAVCVLNADGSVLMQFTVPHTAAGLAELVARLARCGPPERLRVGIESPSGLVVETSGRRRLSGGGDSPNAIKATRPRYRAAGGKSDPGRCVHRRRRVAHGWPSFRVVETTVGRDQGPARLGAHTGRSGRDRVALRTSCGPCWRASGPERPRSSPRSTRRSRWRFSSAIRRPRAPPGSARRDSLRFLDLTRIQVADAPISCSLDCVRPRCRWLARPKRG